MSAETHTYQLIVRQRLSSGDDLDGLLQILQAEHGLDPYTARYRLTGSGYALFGKGGLDEVGAVAAQLRNHEFRCWNVAEREPRFAPRQLRGLEIHDEHLLFETKEGLVRFDRGMTAVAILADVSGQLHERLLRRHMVDRNLQGVTQLTTAGAEEPLQVILKGQPVLDIYSVDDRGQPQAALRVLAGRFNARGLGERMTMSAVRNLEAILRLVEEYAGHFRLHTEFGLGRLPGCKIKTLDGDLADPVKVMDNLTRFGWLMCGLLEDPSPDAERLEPLTLAAAALGTVALAGGHGAGSGLAEMAAGVNAPLTEPAVAEEPLRKEDKGLPPPPDQPVQSRLTPATMLTLTGIFMLFGLIIALKTGNVRWVGPIEAAIHWSFSVGLLPGLFAVGLVWSGLHYVWLRRQVENTPTSRVRSMATGLVEVHGRACRKYALVSPMSMAACVYFRLRKYRKDSNGKWVLKSTSDSGHVPFSIDDSTGRVTVDPSGARVTAKTRQTGVPGDMTMAFSGVSLDGHDEKWVEEVVYEGTSLYVIGYAQPVREERSSLRQRTTERLRQLKLDPRAMRVYDTNQDGRIDEAEWQAARDDAEQQALREHLAERGERKRQEDHLVITRPPQRGLPFVIAETVSEAALVRNYFWFSLALLAAGLAALGYAVYRLLQHLQ